MFRDLRVGTSCIAHRAATASFALTLIVGLATRVNAAELHDADLMALHDYARSIETGRVLLAHADQASHHATARDTDPAYAALEEFAKQVGVDKSEPAATTGRERLAQADNALDALKEWFQQRNAPAAPSTSKKGKGPIAGGTRRSELPIEAVSVGSQVCATCHASSAEHYSRTLMGKIARTQKGRLDCESCHGPGSLHVKAGGGRGVAIISFRPDDLSRTAEQNNEICTACHTRGSHTQWKGSTHDEQGLMCTNCHTVMKNVSRKGLLKTAHQPDTCASCHQKQRSEIWRTSHMPIRTPSLGREGKMVCTDCHSPHGSYSESQLKKATINEVCWTCHAEKRGPFLWEHQPVTESCVNCHEPHGSNNDAMLKISRPRSCQQCHSGGQHPSNPRNPNVTLYSQGRECVNCHSTHHGSNNPAGARFMR